MRWLKDVKNDLHKLGVKEDGDAELRIELIEGGWFKRPRPYTGVINEKRKRNMKIEKEEVEYVSLEVRNVIYLGVMISAKER